MDTAVLDAPPAPVAPPPGPFAPAPAPPRRLVPRRRRRNDVDPGELVVEVIARHADSVLRVARRYSYCQADAEDAYQRALEILVRKAHRLDLSTADKWLRVVVKHEALSILEQRRRFAGVIDDGALDALADARHLPTVEERTERLDELTRAAEALKRLKPNERTALMLRAQGLSYVEIAERQNWTYTKVNRCVTEGRRALLQRMEGLRTGAECERWAPVLSAMADGEATAEQLMDVRPHLRNCSGCRAVLGGMERATAPVAALLPVGGLAALPAAAAESSSEQGAGLLSRLGDLLVGVQDRVTAPVIKAQSAIETFSASKAAAVVASTAAVAGGGVAVEQTVADRPADPPPAAAQAESPASPSAAPAFAAATAQAPAATTSAAPSASGAATPSSDPAAAQSPGSTAAAEFGVGDEQQAQREFASAARSGEFADAADDSTRRAADAPSDGAGDASGGGAATPASPRTDPPPSATTRGATAPAADGSFESGARTAGSFESRAPATTQTPQTPKAPVGSAREFGPSEFGG